MDQPAPASRHLKAPSTSSERHRVSSGSSASSVGPDILLASSFKCEIEFEKELAEQRAAAQSRRASWSGSAFIDIPSETRVVITPRKLRTVTNPFPEESEEGWARDCAAEFGSDLCEVLTCDPKAPRHARGLDYGATSLDELPDYDLLPKEPDTPRGHMSVTPPPQEAAAQAAQAVSRSSTPMPPAFPSEEERARPARWEGKRQKIFSLFPAPDFSLRLADSSSSTGLRVRRVQHTRRFLLEIKEVTFDAGAMEPFFGSVAVFNIATGAKVTEDFVFDVNNGPALSLIHRHQIPILDPIYTSRKALFSITHAVPDMMIILQLRKVLLGELEESMEIYCKPNAARDQAAIDRNVKEMCDRMGEHRQIFAWGWLPLFNEMDSDNVQLHAGDRKFYPLLRHNPSNEGSHMVTISELLGFRSGSMSKKSKTIPGNVTFSLTEVTDASALAGRVTPALCPVNPFPPETLVRHTVVKEIQEFQEAEALTPHSEYTNNLYIYPQCISRIEGRNIAIKVQLFAEDNTRAPPISAFYNSTTGEALSTSFTTAVAYHMKTPGYHDEIKIKLPHKLTSKHHLLFSFYHISLQKTRAVTTPIGYSFLPITTDSKTLVSGEIGLPVACDLADKYLSTQDAKFVEGMRAVFRLFARPQSTVYTADTNLAQFFALQTSVKPPPPVASQTLSVLGNTAVPAMAGWFPVIVKQLFRLMCCVPSLSLEAFNALIDMLERIYSTSPSLAADLMHSFSRYSWVNVRPQTKDAGSEVYEEIIGNWTKCLLSNFGADYERVNRHAPFLFSVIFKSMTLRLHTEGLLGDDGNRTQRFPEQLHTALAQLLVVLRRSLEQHPAVQLSKYLASFLCDLLEIMDRGVVMHLIKTFYTSLATPDDPAIAERKFEFMKIITEYEYYVHLNLPSVAWNSPSYRYLVNVFMGSVGGYLKHSDREVRHKAAVSIRDLFIKHDLDDRFSSDPEAKDLAILYQPFLQTLATVVPTVSSEEQDESHMLLACSVWIIGKMGKKGLREWLSGGLPSGLLSVISLCSRCLASFDYIGRPTESESMRREFIMSPSDRSATRKTFSPGKFTVDQAKILIESFYQSGGGQRYSRKTLTRRVSGEFPSMSPVERRATPALSVDTRWPFRYSAKVEANLSTEVAVTIAEFLETVSETLQGQLSADPNAALLEGVVSLFAQVLMLNQSRTFVCFAYRLLRDFVIRYEKTIFLVKNSSYCSTICNVLISHCNSRNVSTRSEATTMLFFMMCKDYELSDWQHFGLVRRHSTTALSKLSEEGKIHSTRELHMSFASLAEFAKNSRFEDEPKASLSAEEKQRRFVDQTQEYLRELSFIFSDLANLDRFKCDPEITADLYIRIATTYMDSPDLHITWMNTLCNKQAEFQNFTEAAMCIVHAAAYVCEYLVHTMEPKPWFPAGCCAFLTVAPNASEEHCGTVCKVFRGRLPPEFSEDGLAQLLTKCMSLLRRAELYELENECSKLLCPFLEMRRDYAGLRDMHSALAFAFDKILTHKAKATRHLGTYYRVGFYGKRMGEFNGKEFIYKEKQLTRLVEIKDRLIAQLQGVTDSSAEVIMDTAVLDTATLIQDEAVKIQLTKVDPVGKPGTEPESFDRHFGACRFTYDTPFTRAGGKQTDMIAQQWKRKTYLITERPFPYIGKRIPVVSREEVDVEPIDVALEAIQNKTEQIWNQLKTEYVDGKMLQAVLQGSCLPTVNQGPGEICRVFLATQPEKLTPELRCSREKLRQALKEFLEACSAGLLANGGLATDQAQASFQAELVAGFKTSSLDERPWQKRGGMTVPMQVLFIGIIVSGSLAIAGTSIVSLTVEWRSSIASFSSVSRSSIDTQAGIGRRLVIDKTRDAFAKEIARPVQFIETVVQRLQFSGVDITAIPSRQALTLENNEGHHMFSINTEAQPYRIKWGASVMSNKSRPLIWSVMYDTAARMPKPFYTKRIPSNMTTFMGALHISFSMKWLTDYFGSLRITKNSFAMVFQDSGSMNLVAITEGTVVTPDGLSTYTVASHPNSSVRVPVEYWLACTGGVRKEFSFTADGKYHDVNLLAVPEGSGWVFLVFPISDFTGDVLGETTEAEKRASDSMVTVVVIVCALVLAMSAAIVVVVTSVTRQIRLITRHLSNLSEMQFDSKCPDGSKS
eukprot:m51a1_g6691 hypothetical protein (2142) ;mRNA; r:66470-76489